MFLWLYIKLGYVSARRERKNETRKQGKKRERKKEPDIYKNHRGMAHVV